jgi:adenine C2-methylase RlmN of 23S rRNA A2503 and tRNA A37
MSPVPLHVDDAPVCAAPVGLFDEEAAALVQEPPATQALAALRASALRHALRHGTLPTVGVLALEAGSSVRLKQGCSAVIATSRLETALTSRDGSTTKLLVRLHDGLAVEAVLLRHDSGAGRYGDGPRQGIKRSTLCVSSQVGCAMGCTFCATGTMGMVRNLSSCEIAEQALHALCHDRTHLRNVVFMGMGEPMNNYAAVCTAVRLLTATPSKGGFGVAPSRVTISTVGVVPRMQTLAHDLPGVRLALSLHAPTQDVRHSVVPSASTWPLEKLLSAACIYEEASGHAPLIEYVLLAGINDSLEHASQLAALLDGHKWTVNLIPYNDIGVAAHLAAPAAHVIDAFQRALRTEHGVNVTVRRSMGRDIAGACGQLVVATTKTSADIEDLCPI